MTELATGSRGARAHHGIDLDAWSAKRLLLNCNRATVASLSITLTHGSLYAMHSTIASLNFVSYQAGAAYVIGLTSGTDDVYVTYRQPQNRVCLAPIGQVK